MSIWGIKCQNWNDREDLWNEGNDEDVLHKFPIFEVMNWQNKTERTKSAKRLNDGADIKFETIGTIYIMSANDDDYLF